MILRCIILGSLLANIFTSYAQQYYMLVGTYTQTNSKGIYVFSFDTANAKTKLVSSSASSNPSFLAVSPNQKFVYAVNEDADSSNTGGGVSAYRFNKQNGGLHFINQQKSGGNHPCYIETDKTGRFLFTANYTGGSVGVLRVKKNAELDTLAQVVQHRGSSINIERQQSAHVHTCVLDKANRFLYVADLGTDKIITYRFTGKALNPYSEISAAPGSGPRHLCLAPNEKFIYVMEELSGMVACYRVQNGRLQLIERVNALARDFAGSIGSADIHLSPNGKFLYCSNRGSSNSISIFSVDNLTGKIKRISEQPTLGIKPRNFSFDPSGKYLLVANQESNEVVIFKVNSKTGLLKDSGRSIEVPSPVCIKWIKK